MHLQQSGGETDRNIDIVNIVSRRVPSADLDPTRLCPSKVLAICKEITVFSFVTHSLTLTKLDELQLS